MKQKITGILSLLLATVIWGSTFVAQSVGMDLIGPFTFQAVRCGLAVLALAVFSVLLEARRLKGYFQRWADPRLWRNGLLCGVALFIASGLQQIGLIYTDAGKAGFITAMYIVIVPLFGLFFRQRLRAASVAGIVIAVAGMYLLCGAGVGSVNVGDLLLMGCALAFSVQITLIDRLAGDCDSLRLNCVQALVVTLLSALVMLFTEEINIALIVSCWLPLGYAGVLSMGVGYTLQIVGQKRLDPTAASMLMSLESVFAVVFGALLLKERMTGWETAGCILVFAAVILSQLPERKQMSK